jgi:hypothetical protein
MGISSIGPRYQRRKVEVAGSLERWKAALLPSCVRGQAKRTDRAPEFSESPQRSVRARRSLAWHDDLHFLVILADSLEQLPETGNLLNSCLVRESPLRCIVRAAHCSLSKPRIHTQATTLFQHKPDGLSSQGTYPCPASRKPGKMCRVFHNPSSLSRRLSRDIN